jgi:FKBP-type peptidyl-prolyl cis-trans isomerase (trigger factor)
MGLASCFFSVIIPGMKSTLTRLEDGTIQLSIPLAWTEVQKTRDEVVKQAVAGAELPGFRKGKAPKELVEKSLDEMKVNDEILKKLLPQAYMMAVQEHGIKPIINPKIQVGKMEDGKDWDFTALTVEMPEVNLGTYKNDVKSVTAKSKIAVPGKESQEVNFDEVMAAMVKAVSVKIPSLLIEQEVDRQLSNMLDEIKRLGLNLDQYLASTGKTVETLREEYSKKAEHEIKTEFALQKIADTEKIAVEEKEIEEAISKAKDDNERKNLEANRYLLANIIRQQKTLDFLRQL